MPFHTIRSYNLARPCRSHTDRISHGPCTTGHGPCGSKTAGYEEPRPTRTTYPPTDPTVHDLYQLISDMRTMQIDMRTTQLAMRTTQIHQDDILYDIQYELSEQSERVAAIEDELRDWRWYEYDFDPDSDHGAADH
jgi:hypothetical protein